MGIIGSITSKGQTTVPKEVRDKLGLDQGTRIEWIVEGGRAIVRPRKLRAADLAGILGPPPSGEVLTVEQMDEAIMDAVVEDDERIKREWNEWYKAKHDRR